MSKYTTGELAKLCGVSVRTVQYYDNRGLLIPTELSEGGRRLYSDEDLRKMKTVCFLKDTGLSLSSIGELMESDNAREVILLMLEQHEQVLRDEMSDVQDRLERLKELRSIVGHVGQFSVESISDVAHIMESKKQMQKLRAVMILTGIPVTAMQWTSIILWITSGIWWPFAVYLGVAISWGIWVSCYYFRRVAYICPQCHEVFTPKLKEAFWANHTPKTRKLTCPCCHHKGFCVEIYKKKEIGS